MQWDHEGLHLGGYVINKQIFPILLVIIGAVLVITQLLR